jgi:hypothetical protein
MYQLLDQIRQLEIELAQALTVPKTAWLYLKRLCRGLKTIG